MCVCVCVCVCVIKKELQIRKVCIKSDDAFMAEQMQNLKNILIMNNESPLLEVSYGVHNHQTEMREKWLINRIYI